MRKLRLKIMVAGHLREKSGYYYAVLNYTDSLGKRKTKWISTGLTVKGNKKRAEAILMDARRNFNPEEPKVMNGDILFADYMEKWLDIIKSSVAVPTFASYSTTVKKIVAPYFREKEVTLKNLTAKDIQEFYLSELERVSPSSVIHYHANIHKALKYAVKIDLIDVNPADKVERPKKDRYVGSFYDADEVNALFEAAKGSKLELPILFGAFYGLRRSEAIGLKWDAIDFDQNTITIRHTVTSCDLDGKRVLVASDTTKTKSSMRTLPLVPFMRERLLTLKEEQQENRRLCGRSYIKEYLEYVCVNEIGDLIKPHYVTESFPKLLKAKGMRQIRYHDLRHPYVKHTTKIFSLRLMDFQAQAYPDARRKTRGACQLHRGGQSQSPVRPLCNRKRFSYLPPQSKMSWILYAISMRLSGYTSTRSISSSASSVVSVSASKIALDASLRLSCRTCSSCFCFACANTAA